MAEAVVLIGLAAAAAQFTEIGCKIVLHASTLFSRFQQVPQCLQRMLGQIQLLLNLANLASEKHTVQSFPGDADSLYQPQRTHEQASLSWLEGVWKDCVAQARSLETIISSMLCESEDSHTRRLWKRILTVKREESILQIMNEIERYKSILSLWFGQECLQNLHFVRQMICDVHGRQLTQLASEITAMRADMDVRSECRALTVQDASTTRRRYSHQTQQRTLQRESFVRTDPTSINKPAIPSSFAESYCRCRSTGSRSVLRLRNDKLLLQHCNYTSEDCPVHSRSSSETVLQYRKQFLLFPAMVECVFAIKRAFSLPSLYVSLRVEARTEVLPLYQFFENLYRNHLRKFVFSSSATERENGLGTYEHVSAKKQDYLFSVARKILLHAYKTGNASPQDVDEEGRTLLHLQVEFARYGDEAFLARMIRLLLSVGVNRNAVDDNFCTAQQVLAKRFTYSRYGLSFGTHISDDPLDHNLLEWTPCSLPMHIDANDMFHLVFRWPESVSDLGYPQICEIIMRRSIRDLELYISRKLYLKETTKSQNTPLHFAAAAGWSQGVEFLLTQGADRYARDSHDQFALDLAIRNQCTDIVKILLRGDCMSYGSPKRYDRKFTLPRALLAYGLYNNSELQDTIVQALARHKRRLRAAEPYHDLIRNFKDSVAIAEKLFAAGFHNIEEHDELGMTPLIHACREGNMNMVAFLLKHGADVCGNHRDAFLRAGHYIFYGKPAIFSSYYERGNALSPLEEKKLFQAAFDAAAYVNSRCRCSPEGFSPATSTFKAGLRNHYYLRRQAFEEMLYHLHLSVVDLRQQWRIFVRMEIFDRLGLTHTCIRQYPTVRTFPEEDRIEIEEEEEELYSELGLLIKGYDDWQERCNEGIQNCVDTFFDKLDSDLRPTGGIVIWQPVQYDHDILGTGTTDAGPWTTSRGELSFEGHQESVLESYMLQDLFDSAGESERL